MQDTNQSPELSRKLIAILERLLNTGQWDSSLFLKNASKRLLSIKEEAERLINFSENVLTERKRDTTVAPGKMKVYISLYQIAGSNLQSWLHTIKSLSSYNVSRPTYRNEQFIRDLINSKADIERHGYVIAIIDEKDVISIDPPPVDSLGHELLIVKEGALQFPNILEFIHANKVRYDVRNNELAFTSEIVDLK